MEYGGSVCYAVPQNQVSQCRGFCFGETIVLMKNSKVAHPLPVSDWIHNVNYAVRMDSGVLEILKDNTDAGEIRCDSRL